MFLGLKVPVAPPCHRISMDLLYDAKDDMGLCPRSTDLCGPLNIPGQAITATIKIGLKGLFTQKIPVYDRLQPGCCTKTSVGLNDVARNEATSLYRNLMYILRPACYWFRSTPEQKHHQVSLGCHSDPSPTLTSLWSGHTQVPPITCVLKHIGLFG